MLGHVHLGLGLRAGWLKDKQKACGGNRKQPGGQEGTPPLEEGTHREDTGGERSGLQNGGGEAAGALEGGHGEMYPMEAGGYLQVMNDPQATHLTRRSGGSTERLTSEDLICSESPGKAGVIKLYPGPPPCMKDPKRSPSPNHSARSPFQSVHFIPHMLTVPDVLTRPQRPEPKINHHRKKCLDTPLPTTPHPYPAQTF